MKPYIELSFKPTDVNYTINSSVGDRYNEIIFHDRESYVEVMKAFSSHIANRYGVNEIGILNFGKMTVSICWMRKVGILTVLRLDIMR